LKFQEISRESAVQAGPQRLHQLQTLRPLAQRETRNPFGHVPMADFTGCRIQQVEPFAQDIGPIKRPIAHIPQRRFAERVVAIDCAMDNLGHAFLPDAPG